MWVSPAVSTLTVERTPSWCQSLLPKCLDIKSGRMDMAAEKQ